LPRPDLSGLAMTVKFEIKFWKNLEDSGKTLDKAGGVMYSNRQLLRRFRVCKMAELERTVRIRKCRGEVYPRLILGAPSVVARPASFLAYASEQAPQSQRLPRSRLPARRMTPAGEPSLGLLAQKLPPAIAVRRAGQRRQAGRSLAMTIKVGARNDRKSLGLKMP